MDLEIKFSYKIDCALNYSSRAEMLCLFEESKSISPKSIFRFLEELFNVPLYNYKSINFLKNIEFILNYINKQFNHPLKEIIFHAGVSKLNNNLLPVKKVIEYLNEISKYREYYAALNIVISSCKRNNIFFIVTEELYNSILEKWTKPLSLQ